MIENFLRPRGDVPHAVGTGTHANSGRGLAAAGGGRRYKEHMEALSGEALPECLRVIPDPPRRLYVRGATEALAAPSVAIVGSRRASRAGRQFAETLAGDLAAAGLVVVSGLAYGIDAAAHRGALAGGGRTVAVLGSGLDRVYPRQHTVLAAEITDGGGAVVSEYAADRSPRKHQFPERNRLISGLSLGVVIVEATTKSGSLITARMAAEQGREVMAVPGPVASPLSGGCHRLLKSGAALIETADDVLYAVGYDTAERTRKEGERAPDRLAAVLEQVGAETTTLDQVVGATGMALEAAAEALVELELLGFVAAHRGGYIRRPS
ncbi:MAG: DNA-protecting protein DprA [Gammaproteobacteria bacterium]|nr:DNA-protecting protein DprA [Gammaproteobacteria bacterium]